MRKTRSDLETFESRYIPEPMSGCWIWTGNDNGFGYGLFRIGKRRIMAHRVAWELYCGPIPDGLQANHKCDVPSCVNPNHLYLGTQAENLEDCRQRGRARKRSRPTHCPHGHEYTPKNIKIKQGRLRCRTCVNIDQQKIRLRRKEKTYAI
jgi:hypothetical protein